MKNFFSFLWFLPLLSPFYLLPGIGDLATYFVIGSELTGAQGLFLHYRIMLAPILAWATIVTITHYKIIRSHATYVALYLLFFILLVQYLLHLPLSYLTKEWFWIEPSGVRNINTMKDVYLPVNASLVSQNNLHIIYAA